MSVLTVAVVVDGNDEVKCDSNSEVVMQVDGHQYHLKQVFVPWRKIQNQLPFGHQHSLPATIPCHFIKSLYLHHQVEVHLLCRSHLKINI